MLDLQKKLDAPTLLLLGGIVFWIALYAFIGPQPFGGDGFYFKDVAINFINGMGFKEIAGPGNPTLTEYKYYATYPPVYSLLYTIYVFVFGVGDYQNTYFNLLLQIIRSVFLFIIIVKYTADWTPSQKLIITGSLILFIPIHASYDRYDRPEDLVAVLFLLSLLLYLRQQHKIAFLVAGLNLMTSIVCGLISAVILLGIYFHDVFRERVEWKALIEKSYPVLYMLVFPVIIVAILAFLDTSIFERWYEYFKYMTERHRPSSLGYIKEVLLTKQFTFIAPLFCFYLIVFWGLFVSVFAYRFSEKNLAFFMSALIVIIFFLNWQGRSHYYWFFSAIGLTVGMYLMMRDVEPVKEMRQRGFWVCIGLILLLTFPRVVVREIYVRTVPMNSEKYRNAKEQVESFFKDKPDNEFILLGDPKYYFFVKSLKTKVALNDGYFYLEDKSNFPRYVVTTSTTRDSIISFKQYKPRLIASEVEKTCLYRKVFETEKSVPNPQNTFWERLLMRPYDTWYPVIYERIDEQQTHIP